MAETTAIEWAAYDIMGVWLVPVEARCLQPRRRLDFQLPSILGESLTVKSDVPAVNHGEVRTTSTVIPPGMTGSRQSARPAAALRYGAPEPQ